MALAALLALGLATAGQPSADLELHIAVYNHSDARGPVLVRAQVEVSEIFSNLGVRIVWRTRATGRSDATPIELTLIVLRQPMDGRTNRAGELGFAPGAGAERGRIAYVFFDRVEAIAADHRIEVPSILGLAMAHEIGHLLLPAESHSPGGIMQATWGHDALHSFRRERLDFTAEQAELIRSALR
jgi:hypothetical protein